MSQRLRERKSELPGMSHFQWLTLIGAKNFATVDQKGSEVTNYKIANTDLIECAAVLFFLTSKKHILVK